MASSLNVVISVIYLYLNWCEKPRKPIQGDQVAAIKVIYLYMGVSWHRHRLMVFISLVDEFSTIVRQCHLTSQEKLQTCF